MKHFLVGTTMGIKAEQTRQGETIQIEHPHERWEMNLRTKEDDGQTDRELAEIDIKMPGGQRYKGTIQSLMWIKPIIKNAVAALEKLKDQVTFTEDETDTICELRSILTNFGDVP